VYTDLGATTRGWLQSGGTYSTFSVPGRTYIEARGVNNTGSVVGFYRIPSGTPPGNPFTHAGFLMTGSNYTGIFVTGSMLTEAWGINTAGQVVGRYVVYPSAATHGFLLSAGVYTTIDVPGSVSTAATGINDAGQVVGYYRTPDAGYHGFLATPA
jgi:probable HAF family extracellular repeat protein